MKLNNKKYAILHTHILTNGKDCKIKDLHKK